MIDEAQDINECQASILLLTIQRTQVRTCRHPLTVVPANTKCYLIGDPYQSIYIFRGASQALEKAINALHGATSSTALCTLSASHRFGSNIAAVDNTYVQYSLKFSQQARYARMYNKTAVPVPYDAPQIHGAAQFAGIIHKSTSAELKPPYTVLCMTNRGVLEAGFKLLGMNDLTDNSASTATATTNGSSPTDTNVNTNSTTGSSQPSSSSTSNSVTSTRQLRLYIVAKNRDRHVQESDRTTPDNHKTDFEQMLDKIAQLREVALGRISWKHQDIVCNSIADVEALSDDLDDPNLSDRCRIVRKLMTVSDTRFAAIMKELKAAQVKDIKTADVIVCTAHFAKGSEYNRVQ
jgi:hypothetical protein